MTESAQRRTFQKVRRDSRQAGTFEHEFWTPLDVTQARKIREGARRYDIAHKRPGRRNGALGHVAREVLDALLNTIDYSTGRLELSIDRMMAMTGRCRDAVVSALKRLNRAGFLSWVRRFVLTGGRGKRGPQVAQTSNAYALALPADAEALLAEPRERQTVRAGSAGDLRLMRDHLAWRARVAADAASRPYRADHYANPLAYLQRQPPILAASTLKRLGVLIDECESVRPFESRLRNLLKSEGAAKPRHADAAGAAE